MSGSCHGMKAMDRKTDGSFVHVLLIIGIAALFTLIAISVSGMAQTTEVWNAVDQTGDSSPEQVAADGWTLRTIIDGDIINSSINASTLQLYFTTADVSACNVTGITIGVTDPGDDRNVIDGTVQSVMFGSNNYVYIDTSDEATSDNVTLLFNSSNNYTFTFYMKDAGGCDAWESASWQTYVRNEDASADLDWSDNVATAPAGSDDRVYHWALHTVFASEWEGGGGGEPPAGGGYNPTADWAAGTETDDATYTGSTTKRWFYANMTSNTTLSAAQLEIIGPDESSGTNYSMTTNGYYAYLNKTQINISTTGNGTFYYRAWAVNGSSANVTGWRTVNFNVTYIQYEILTDSSDNPEACYAHNGIITCAQEATPSVSYRAWYVVNGTAYQTYGSGATNTAPYVSDDGEFVYGSIDANNVFYKWHRVNATQICSYNYGALGDAEGFTVNDAETLAYIVAGGNTVRAVWMSNCTLAMATSETVNSNPIVTIDEINNRLYVATTNLLYSFYLNNFTKAWQATTDGEDPYYAPPLIADDEYVQDYTIITTTRNAGVYAFYFNGTAKWNMDIGDLIFQGGAYKKGKYVVGDCCDGDAEAEVNAIWVNNGTLAWNFTNTSLTHCGNAPVISSDSNGDYVYTRCAFCEDSGCSGPNYDDFYQVFYILNLEDGGVIDYVKYGNRGTSMPTILYGGYAFVGTQPNTYRWYAIKISAGGELVTGVHQLADGYSTRDFGTSVCTDLFFSDASYVPSGVTAYQTYNATAYETTDQTFTIVFEAESDVDNVTANLWYDGTEYGYDTWSVSGDNYTITKEISIPLATSDGVSYDFYWNYTITFDDASTSNQDTDNETQTVNYAYSIDTVTVTASDLIEAQDLEVTVEVEDLIGAATYTMRIWVNDTAYTMDDDDTTFTYDYNTSMVGDSVFNYSLPWNVSLNVSYGSSFRIENSSTYTATIYKLVLTNCTGMSNITTLHFYVKDEDSDAAVTANLDMSFDVWKTGELARNYSWELTDQNNYTICIYPSWAAYVVDMISQFDADGYSQRNYYLNDATISNTTQTIYLYLGSNETQDLITMQVLNSLSLPEPDVYINIAEYNIGTGTYTTVAIVKTDYDGKAYSYLTKNTKWYRFTLTQDGVVLDQYDPTIITEDTLTFRLTQGDLGEYFTYYDDIAWNCTWPNNTTTCTVTDTSGLMASAQLEVWRWSALGYIDICDTEDTGSSVTLVCPMGSLTGYIFYYKLTAEFQNSEQVLEAGFRNHAGQTDIYGNLGILVSMIILFVLVFIGLAISWEAGLVMSAAAVTLSYIGGFVLISQTSVLGVFIAIAIAIYKYRRR